MTKKETFGVIVTYSEDGKDVDELIKMYEEWAAKQQDKRFRIEIILFQAIVFCNPDTLCR